MRWEKLGPIFNVNRRSRWMFSHAYVPTAHQIEDGKIRIFLAFRDEAQIGRIGWIDVEANDPTRVIGVSEEPALDIGEPGAFDDNGVTPMSVVQDGDHLRLYYAGWQLTPRARYLLFTGLAISEDGGNKFVRYQDTPVLDRTPTEFLVRSGFIMYDHDSNSWKAWYAAGSSLVGVGEKLVPSYHLAHAESKDGITWPASGTVAIRPNGPDEYGFGRSHIRKYKGKYEIWYSARSHSQLYTIGYATSTDGLHWDRRDAEGGLPRSPSGWDSEMTCFPSIIENQYGRFMFYNGNDYGRTGVGVAKWSV
jgi:predicted GH43/DUF377 family glycosyl hydrolase